LKNRKKELEGRDFYQSNKNNTKLLLEMYRRVSFHVHDRLKMKDEEIYATKRQHLEELVISFLELDSRVNVRKLEDSLIDVHVSLSLLELMDFALERLKRYPQKGEIYADILRLRYFDEGVLTCEELVYRFNMSRSTFFRYLNKAIESYGNMLFGYALPETVEALQTIQTLPMVAEMAEKYRVERN